MRTTKSIGMILLAVFLILTGLFHLIDTLAFTGQRILMGILALAAGVFILMGR